MSIMSLWSPSHIYPLPKKLEDDNRFGPGPRVSYYAHPNIGRVTLSCTQMRGPTQPLWNAGRVPMLDSYY